MSRSNIDREIEAFDRTVKIGLVLLCAVFVIGIFLLGLADNRDAEQWETYKEEHHCEVIDTRTEYHRTYLITSSTTRTLWRCDDGERWR
jgi:hypothetical protein